MCSIYVLCKILEIDVKFKTIANMYNSLPDTDSKVSLTHYVLRSSLL